MARKNKKYSPPGQGLGLATTVKVDPGLKAPRVANRGLRQRITGVAQRFLPLKRPAVGIAPHHINRPSPNPARYANMASNKSSKFTFKNFRFSIIFALLLGLAGAGGYAMMNALSKSFNKVTDLVDYKRWVKPSSPASSYAGNSHREGKAGFFSGESNNYQTKNSFRETSYQKGKLSKKSFRGQKSVRGSRIARHSKVRDPFYKEHHPLSKKHAIKHRKWSKKLAKIRKNSDRKFHSASYRSKRAKHKAK